MSTMASQITSLTILYLTIRSKKISKLRVTGLCVGNSPVTSEFPGQMASNAEKASIWWGHHATLDYNEIYVDICVRIKNVYSEPAHIKANSISAIWIWVNSDTKLKLYTLRTTVSEPSRTRKNTRAKCALFWSVLLLYQVRAEPCI